MADELREGEAFTVCVYAGKGLPPTRTDYTDLAKAEKALETAKTHAILFKTRPPTLGLGWIKIKEKQPAPEAPKPAAKTDH